jgi:effector-binding domain-containing protein
MSDYSTEPQIVILAPAHVAVVRETVPMSALTDFFSRAFHATMAATQAQGVPVVGPPFGMYFGMPSETVDVAAGFPTASPISPTDDGVTTTDLPGGRAVQVLHVGTYDSLEGTYARLMAWLGERGLQPADVMWESYLNEPDPTHPETSETLITWPLGE